MGSGVTDVSICKSHKLKNNCAVLCGFIHSSHVAYSYLTTTCSHSAEEDGKVQYGCFLFVPKAVSWKIRGWLFFGGSICITYAFEQSSYRFL